MLVLLVLVAAAAALVAIPLKLVRQEHQDKVMLVAHQQAEAKMNLVQVVVVVKAQ
jgi:archaellin